MKADKGQFDEVLRRMLAKKPKKTVEIRAVREGEDPHPERRKNPSQEKAGDEKT
jgi:hypothetical protein